MKALRFFNGAVLLEAEQHDDERGYLVEAWSLTALNRALSTVGAAPVPGFVQSNISVSRRGVLRGLHFQTHPREQGKLVRVLKGCIWDVAVNLLSGSPEYLQWRGVELSHPTRAFWIPPGYAHGFLALEPDTVVSYSLTQERSAEHERTLAFDDPQLNIFWPTHLLSKPGDSLLLSDKDRNAPTIQEGALR